MNGKFKVWNKINKAFVNISNNEDERVFFLKHNGDYWENEWTDAYGYRSKQISESKYEFVHSTGQTDKNGVEIYEGDIRQCSVGKYVVEVGPFVYTDPDGDDHNFSGIHKKWISRFKDDISPFDTVRDQKNKHLGNKFENPELMETK